MKHLIALTLLSMLLAGCMNTASIDLPFDEGIVIIAVDQALAVVSHRAAPCNDAWRPLIGNHDALDEVPAGGLIITFVGLTFGTHCIMIAAPDGFESTAIEFAIGDSGGLIVPRRALVGLHPTGGGS